MSGGFTRRLVLEQRSSAPDGGGGTTETWTALGIHWVALKPTNARERQSGARSGAEVTHKGYLRAFEFNSSARPRADQRFREGSRIFAIRAVTEADDRRERLLCWLTEGAVT
jgi:SPP1 family predicted phage head-tail adaptor